MHNHLVHHALTLYALGAPPDVIIKNHVRNQLYQRVSPPMEPAVIQNLDDSATFQSSLGKEGHYLNFVRYFEQQIQTLGWPEFFEKFLFGDTELANDMMCRLFAGYLHPILGVGFAVEFHQPAILAEAFAQASVHHDDHLKQFLQAADAAATTGGVESAPLTNIIEAVSKDPTVKSSADIKFFRQVNENGEMCAKLDHIRDGVIAIAGPKVVEFAAKWQVKPNEIEQKTAELINTAGTDTTFHSDEIWLTERQHMWFVLHNESHMSADLIFSPYTASPPLYFTVLFSESLRSRQKANLESWNTSVA
jgi:hypothetical protein